LSAPGPFELTLLCVLSSRDSAAGQERKGAPALSERLDRTRALIRWPVAKIP